MTIIIEIFINLLDDTASMIRDKLGLDDKDVHIASRLMQDPSVSQADLAQELKLSQPSINARIHKLKERGILTHLVGIDHNKTDMCMVRVDCTAQDAQEILTTLQHCSFFVNGFVMSGTCNVCLFVVGHDLKKVEAIINRHLRSNPKVRDIAMHVVVSAAKPFIYAINLEHEEHEECKNPSACGACPLHTPEKGKELTVPLLINPTKSPKKK